MGHLSRWLEFAYLGRNSHAVNWKETTPDSSAASYDAAVASASVRIPGRALALNTRSFIGDRLIRISTLATKPFVCLPTASYGGPSTQSRGSLRGERQADAGSYRWNTNDVVFLQVQERDFVARMRVVYRA